MTGPRGNGTGAQEDLRFVGCCHPSAREAGYVGPQLTWERMQRAWPKLVGCPILDNHRQGQAPIGKVVDAWVDGKRQLWVRGQIDESTSEGARVAGLIRAKKYRGLSLGMQHMTLKQGAERSSRASEDGEVEQGWEDVSEVEWSDIVEVSVCEKGKYEHTVLHSFFSDNAPVGAPPTSVSDGEGGAFTLFLDSSAPAGLPPRTTSFADLPFSMSRIFGGRSHYEGREKSADRTDRTAAPAPSPTPFGSFASVLHQRRSSQQRKESVDQREKTASTALNPNGNGSSIVSTTPPQQQCVPRELAPDSVHDTPQPTTRSTTSKTSHVNTNRNFSHKTTVHGKTTMSQQQQQQTATQPSAPASGGGATAANLAALQGGGAPAQTPQQQQPNTQQGNGASLPKSEGASVASPASARPSPVPRFKDGKFAPYRTTRTGAPPSLWVSLRYVCLYICS